jgi:hypothetical protein
MDTGNAHRCGGIYRRCHRGEINMNHEQIMLELMALATFKHFPMVTHVKAGLLFVVSKDFVKDQYPIESEAALWEKWLQQYNRMRDAYVSNVWNPRPSGLCKKHCVVLSCPHNGRN